MRVLPVILLLPLLAASVLHAAQADKEPSRQTVDCLITLEINADGRTRVISDNTLPHASARFYGRLLQALAVNGASWLARFEFRQPVLAVSARTDGGAAWLRADGGQALALPNADADFLPPPSGKSFTIHMSQKPTRVQLIVRGERIPGYRPTERPKTLWQREQARDVISRFRQAIASGQIREVVGYFPPRGVSYKKGKIRSRLSLSEALGMLAAPRGTSPRIQNSRNRIIIDVPLESGTRRWTLEESGSAWLVRQIEELEFALPTGRRPRESFWSSPHQSTTDKKQY